MASRGAASIFMALALLPQASFAASLTHSDRVMRNEPTGVQLTAKGEMIQFHKSKLGPEGGYKNPDEPYCNRDYPVGTNMTSICKNPIADGGDNKDELMDEEAMCIEAATEAKASQGSWSGTFKLPTEWQDKRPKGCFKEACKAEPNGVCYYWNAADDATNIEAGSPICARPKFLFGDTSLGDNGKCTTLHPDYQLIDDFHSCKSAAICLGYTPGDAVLPTEEFRVGEHNASKHLDYVQGCFFLETGSINGNTTHGFQRTVYWNPPNDIGHCTGANCRGTQLCNVTTPTSWPTASPSATEPPHVTDPQNTR